MFRGFMPHFFRELFAPPLRESLLRSFKVLNRVVYRPVFTVSFLLAIGMSLFVF
jgi:hypothetical protein